MQIANYADFCNECGNCDTFCPEYGGPYIKKPGFYSSEASWLAAAPRDGFVVRSEGHNASIVGRIRGACYELERDERAESFIFRDGNVTLTLSASDHRILASRVLGDPHAEHRVDMGIYHTLRHLLAGVLDAQVIHQVNVATATP
jgi:hypothetical protein